MSPLRSYVRPLVGALLLLLLAPSGLADQIDVPGDYAVLQDAVDAASPGDVIVVDGGEHPSIVVDKELSIVGVAGNPPFLHVDFGVGPLGQDPAVTLDGPGSGRVVLSGVEVGGTAGGVVNGAADPIAGGGFDELWILHSTVTATEWVNPTGAGFAARAVSVDVGHVLVEDSTIRGGAPISDSVWTDAFVYSGGAAISTTGDVSCFDSIVVGGDGLTAYMFTGIFDPGGCQNLFGGLGGRAVVTPGTLWHANTIFAAGEGATISVNGSSGPEYVCNLPSGPALGVGAAITFGSLMLPPAGGLGPGDTLTLQWISPDTASQLVFSVVPTAPVRVGTAGWLYMDPEFLVIIPVPGAGVVTLPVATSDPVLTGFPLAFQIYTSAVGLSRPVFATFLPD